MILTRSGTGLAGLAAAAAGVAEELVLTDCNSAVLENLRFNCSINAEVLATVRLDVRELDFANQTHALASHTVTAEPTLSLSRDLSLSLSLSHLFGGTRVAGTL